MKKEMKPIELPADVKRGMIHNDMRNKDVVQQVQQSIEDFKKDYDDNFKKVQQENAQLKQEAAENRNRLEELECRVESRSNGPGRTLAQGETNAPFKTFHANEGRIFELPSTVKLETAMPPSKQAPVSFERWLSAFAGGEHCKDRQAVEYFRDIKSQLETGTSGVLIPQEYIAGWIDRIRSAMVLNAAGITTVTMADKVQNSSAVVEDPAATWHTESATINADNPTFAARSLTAHTLVCRCQASLEVTQDSPSFGSQLAQVMAASMAVELDRVGLMGSGTPPEPAGILQTANINKVTSVGSITDFSKMLSGVRKLLDANVPLDVATSVAIMSPGVWLAYENLVTGLTSDKTQLRRPQSLQNTRFLVTTNGLDVGSPATSTIFMGNFADLVLGIRATASIEALKLTTYASNLLVEFIGYLRADYMVRRPSSFCKLEDVTPAA